MNLKATKRLKEALSFWIKCASSYCEPEEFVINLNACIQSLRNVTFVLQAQKREIPSFDSWYSTWQLAMKADPILRWCVDARNQIVKQDDLKKKSFVLATYHEGYLVEQKAEVEVPIDAPSRLVAELLVASLGSSNELDGFLRIERQWKTEDLEDVELLSGLSHVFTVLSFLLEDVENQIGPSPIYPSFEPKSSQLSHAEIRHLLEEVNPEFMNEFEDYRTSWFKLPELERVALREESVSLPELTLEEAKQRYKIRFPDLNKYPSLKERVSALGVAARRVLETDGHHINILFLSGRDGKTQIITTEYHDQAHKYAFWARIARLVRRKGIKEIISIGEVWNYSVDDIRAYRSADKIPDKREALVIAGGRRPGEFQMLSIPFAHEGGQIMCEDGSWSTEPPNFYLRILKEWKTCKGFC